MTYVQLTPPASLPTEDDVAALENQIGYDFPEDFRTFLLETNGGQPVKYHLVRIEECKDDVLMHVFLGIGTTPSIEETLDNIGDELPDGFIVIASDPGGNKFLMDLSEGEPTPIYYWDRVRVFKKSKRKANTYEIASNFTEFMGMLRLMPDD